MKTDNDKFQKISVKIGKILNDNDVDPMTGLSISTALLEQALIHLTELDAECINKEIQCFLKKFGIERSPTH